MSTIEIRPAHLALEHAPAVSATDVSRSYGRGDLAVPALRGVSVEIGRGELTAVLGAAGSGKSTLLHVLAGRERASTGAVRIAGIETAGLKTASLRRLRHEHVALVYEHFNLVPALTVEENVLAALEQAGRAVDAGFVDELMTIAGLGERRGERASALSCGQQQKAALVRALASRPTVLFADEPTGSVGWDERDEILALLRHAASSYGQSIVLATEDPHVAAIADRVLLLEDGMLVDDRR